MKQIVCGKSFVVTLLHSLFKLCNNVLAKDKLNKLNFGATSKRAAPFTTKREKKMTSIKKTFAAILNALLWGNIPPYQICEKSDREARLLSLPLEITAAGGYLKSHRDLNIAVEGLIRERPSSVEEIISEVNRRFSLEERSNIVNGLAVVHWEDADLPKIRAENFRGMKKKRARMSA
ncbi:MAG: hypothetical protein GW939_01025 [Candidatus Magasanikbacteria bacterium]|uniref:Uncharacterized protein n=1 Tax=Candidatus Magasanikbacteria bacterium CG10_big_fil_rev_8_21_14_0_10_38_6 TaxID=1974647 RepID=A0A2M6P1S2_9BACT|nr:hypothetical protein [Candidatus Magasanikbacteria bacterium]NCS71865.1 hypothetical protein [Candidatus Magasanikbacteria bacterium]PIR77683.1 MAG: hypothetical protein COU30_01105 [Candidatus Magasanikbacteria bacterium CG10_big_fil_rev_8_21_14_0_10_38_6]